MAEFTGERVIPGQVDPDLWNEHRARYLFAARLSRGKRVLDVGCGTGYGAAEMAPAASRVVGLDVAAEALRHARESYGHRANIVFLKASATDMPFREATFDLMTAFEVIEHLPDWERLLEEARRVLAPSGQLIVSTPNKLYYAESRRLTGPNPFHEHEFEFDEFRQALGRFFPHVSLFLQNHCQSIVFQPVPTGSGADVRVEGGGVQPEQSHFFVAVCAKAPQTGAPTFVHLPSSGNLLRERELHIASLEGELATKNQWLEESKQEHSKLVEMFRAQHEELEQRTRWAEKLDADLKEAAERCREEMNAAVAEVQSGYEAKLAELEEVNRAKTEWALETERRLGKEVEERSSDLGRCADALHETERTLEERTAWALRLEASNRELEAKISMVQASRWIKLGRVIGLGPEVHNK